MRAIAHFAGFLTLLSMLAACAATPEAQTPLSNAPFIWPESYMVTDKMTSLSHPGKPAVINAYKKDGLKARNESTFMKDKIFGDTSVVEIFRLDLHKRYGIHADGTVKEVDLPADWNQSYIFPRTGSWEALGNDIVDGIPARKYKITRAPEHRVVQLPPSERDPKHAPIKLPAELYNKKYMTLPPYVTVWLTTDNKTPLRMENGEERIDFLNYYAGPIDPVWFEVPKRP
jgi:hypothetical protein